MPIFQFIYIIEYAWNNIKIHFNNNDWSSGLTSDLSNIFVLYFPGPPPNFLHLKLIREMRSSLGGFGTFEINSRRHTET